MNADYVEIDISKFGARERGMVMDIFEVWDKLGLPEYFSDDGVRIGFNLNSGCVFLTNDDYMTLMVVGGKWALWFDCPTCGNSGFYDEMMESDCAQCKITASNEQPV